MCLCRFEKDHGGHSGCDSEGSFPERVINVLAVMKAYSFWRSSLAFLYFTFILLFESSNDRDFKLQCLLEVWSMGFPYDNFIWAYKVLGSLLSWFHVKVIKFYFLEILVY